MASNVVLNPTPLAEKFADLVFDMPIEDAAEKLSILAPKNKNSQL
jgi:hypothetical protein